MGKSFAPSRPALPATPSNPEASAIETGTWRRESGVGDLLLAAFITQLSAGRTQFTAEPTGWGLLDSTAAPPCYNHGSTRPRFSILLCLQQKNKHTHTTPSFRQWFGWDGYAQRPNPSQSLADDDGRRTSITVGWLDGWLAGWKDARYGRKYFSLE